MCMCVYQRERREREQEWGRVGMHKVQRKQGKERNFVSLTLIIIKGLVTNARKSAL